MPGVFLERFRFSRHYINFSRLLAVYWLSSSSYRSFCTGIISLAIVVISSAHA